MIYAVSSENQIVYIGDDYELALGFFNHFDLARLDKLSEVQLSDDVLDDNTLLEKVGIFVAEGGYVLSEVVARIADKASSLGVTKDKVDQTVSVVQEGVGRVANVVTNQVTDVLNRLRQR